MRVFLLLFLLSFGTTYSHEEILQKIKEYQKQISKKNKEIQLLRSSIKRGRERLKKLDKKRGTLSRKAKHIHSSIKTLLHQIQRIDADKERVQREWQQVERRIQKLLRKEREVKEYCVVALVLLHKKRLMHSCPPLYEEMWQREMLLQNVFHLLKSSLSFVQRCEKIKDVLSKKSREKREKLRLLKKERRGREKLLSEKRRLQERVEERLIHITRRQVSLRREIRKLQRENERLQALLSSLMEERKAAEQAFFEGSRFAALKGRLPWPVRCKKLLRKFGSYSHPRFNAIMISRGIQILSEKGAKVCAIYGGKVVFSKKFGSYGKTVIIDHGKKYFTIYANLAKVFVKEGDLVTGGQLIANVKESLHFQLRRGREALDPLGWLTKESGGGR
jgi:septal ring factor EnvC (AmiA/AmiB activator)